MAHRFLRDMARIVRGDIDAYLDVKDPACVIMVGAEDWARATELAARPERPIG